MAAQRAELGDEQQALGLGRQRTKAIAQLLANGLNLTCLLGPRQPPIEIELRIVVGDITVGQVRGEIERHIGRREQLPAPGSLVALLQRPHGFLEPAEIGIEPDRLDVPRLFAAEQIPRPAQLQVAQRDAIAGSQVCMMLEHL